MTQRIFGHSTPDSKEEIYFAYYLLDLLNYGMIDQVEYHPKKFILCEKETIDYFIVEKEKKKKQSFIVNQQRTYSTDFKIFWSESSNGFLNFALDQIDFSCFKIKKIPFVSKIDSNGKRYSYVEIKSDFTKHNSTRMSKTAISIVYSRYKEFVNLIMIPKIFKETFTPSRYLLTDSGKQKRKINFEAISFESWKKHF